MLVYVSAVFEFILCTCNPQSSSGGGGLAQGPQQQGPADWTSLHPAVSPAELWEEQISGSNRGAELEADSPGPDPCGPNTAVRNITYLTGASYSVHIVLVKRGSTTVSLSVRHSEKVAELSYVATLEDLGLVKVREVIVSDSSQVNLCVIFNLRMRNSSQYSAVQINTPATCSPTYNHTVKLIPL